MTGKDTVTGTLSAVAKLSGTGDNPDAIKKALNGNLALSFSDGAVKGVNLVRVVRQAQAVVKGKPYVEKSEVEQTDFSTLTATASVADGVVRNNDLEAKSPLLRIQGKGSVNLGKESIDYLLTTTIVGTLEGQGGRELSDLKGIPIPIEVNGTFSKPRYEPRLDEALKQVAGEKVKEKVEEEKEKLREKAEKKLQKKLGKELGDGLKGLFH
jgi:AsmA protein